MRTREQSEAIKLALKTLGGATQNKITIQQAHHQIFGMYLLAISLDALSSELGEIETASTRLWIHSDHRLPGVGAAV